MHISTPANSDVLFRLLASIAACSLSVFPVTQAIAEEQDTDDRTSEHFGIEEIVVTARRRSERLIDTPVAMTTFGADELERTRTTDVTETLGMVPNLYIEKNRINAAHSNIMMRGIGLSTPLNPSVAVFMDGVYMPGNSWRMNFLAVERVEVLRGPQGALFGRNTEAGVLNITSKSPESELSGSAKLDYGSFDTLSGEVYVTGPITDSLLYSVAGRARRTNGYTTSISDGTEVDAQREETVRLALKMPGDRLTLTARADWNAGRGGFPVDRVVESPSPLNQPGRWEAALDVQPYATHENYGGALTVEYDLDLASLTSITAWRHQWSVTQSDDDNTVTPNYGGGPTNDVLGSDESFWPSPEYRPSHFSDIEDFPRPTGFGNLYVYWTRQDVLSQEFRIVSNDNGRLKWIGGVYGYRDKTRSYFERSMPNATPIVVSPSNGVWYKNDLVSKGYSIFGQVTYEIVENLEATVAARYSYEEVSEDVYEAFDFRSGDIVLLQGEYTQQQSVRFEDFIPQGSLTYHWTDDFMTYVNVGQGYKGGGFPRTAPTTPEANIPFQSEISTNYEVGSKATMFDGRLFASMALFYIDVKDAQVAAGISINGILTPVTTNAAKVRSKGVEIDVTARPFQSLTVRGSLGYTDAYYVDYVPNPATDLTGAKLPNVPRWTGSVGAVFTRPFFADTSISIGADYRYIGRQLRGTGTAVDPYVPTPAYDVLNADISLQTEMWNFTFYAENVFDSYNLYAYQPTGPSILSDRALYPALERPAGPPRSIGIRADYRF